jgi:autotransporter-associated beta strand protein
MTRLRSSRTLATVGGTLVALAAGQAMASVWMDTNGTTSGAGTLAGATWDLNSTANWNTGSGLANTNTPVTWTAATGGGDLDAVLQSTASGTINLADNITANSLRLVGGAGTADVTIQTTGVASPLPGTQRFISLNGGDVTVDSGRILTFSSNAISGSNLSGNFRKMGAGNLTINQGQGTSALSYSGTATIQEGAVLTNQPVRWTTNSQLVMTGGAFRITYADNVSSSVPSHNVNVGLLAGSSAASFLEGSNNGAAGNRTARFLRVNQTATSTYAGGTRNSDVASDESFGLVKAGNGVLELTGSLAHTQRTTVESGTLLINPAGGAIAASIGDIRVSNGGTLGGSTVGKAIVTSSQLIGTASPTNTNTPSTPLSGTIAATDANVVVAAGGKISPGGVVTGGTAGAGTFSNTVGNLVFALGNDVNNGSAVGQLNLSAAAGTANTLLFEIGASTATSDQITLNTGVLNIGSGLLNFSTFGFTNLGVTETTYTLIDTNAAIVGTLAPSGLSGSIGAYTGTLQLSPDGQDVQLVVVIPEPASAMTLAALGGLLLRRRARA